MTARERREIAAAMNEPLIASLLYDLDLMPEQVKAGDKRREFYMASAVQHMLAALNKPRRK